VSSAGINEARYRHASELSRAVAGAATRVVDDIADRSVVEKVWVSSVVLLQAAMNVISKMRVAEAHLTEGAVEFGVRIKPA
jgi:hypothetical protein